MKTVIGKAVNVSDRYWFFVTDEGEEIKLHFDGVKRPPTETPIALSISDEPEYEDGGYVVDTESKYWSHVSNGVAAMTNTTRKHIALYWQHWPGRDTDSELETAKKWAAELERFYRQYARGKWDVQVRAFIWMNSTQRATPPNYGLNYIMNGDDKVDTGDFKPNYHHIVSIHAESGYCGLGNVNGNKSATYRYGGNCDEHTVIHELGHNFGLHHANDHEDGEYRDKTCVMGMGPHIPGLNSVHLLELRLENEEEVLVVNQSTQAFLCPIEMPFQAMHENEYQYIVMERDGKDKFYLSLRKQKGWPWDPGRLGESALYIHYRKEGKSWFWDSMTPNSSPKRLPNGVTVTYHEYANEMARVSVDYNDGIVPVDLTMPEGFPEIFTGAELGPQHNGLWYKEEFWGQGLDLHVQNGEMKVQWLTYNVEQESRRWYYGSCPLSQGSEEFALYTREKGTFEDPSTALTHNIGVGQLYFLDANTGWFNFNTSEHGRGSVAITSIATNQDVRSGIWHDPTKVNSGFTIQFFPHLNKAIAYWCTFGAWNNAIQRYGIETQRWFYCDGVKKNDMNYKMTILEPREGKFGTYVKPTLVDVGNAELTVLNNDTLRFSYDISADPSTTGSGIQNLVRV